MSFPQSIWPTNIADESLDTDGREYDGGDGDHQIVLARKRRFSEPRRTLDWHPLIEGGTRALAQPRLLRPHCGDPIMLSPETLEMYRKMTPSERLKLTLEMIRENTPRLFRGTEAEIDRRFEILRRQNDDRTRTMLDAFARMK